MSLFPEKIRIVGSVGSGKTTLAKLLSKELHIPYYELDIVVWKKGLSVDIKRTEQERDEYLNSLLDSTNWIIDGVHFQEWVLSTFDRSELVIFMDTPYLTRVFLIILRYIKQITGKEESHYKPTFKIFFNMFKWNHDFEYSAKPKLLRYLEEQELTYITLKNVKELKLLNNEQRSKSYANK